MGVIVPANLSPEAGVLLVPSIIMGTLCFLTGVAKELGGSADVALSSLVPELWEEVGLQWAGAVLMIGGGGVERSAGLASLLGSVCVAGLAAGGCGGGVLASTVGAIGTAAAVAAVAAVAESVVMLYSTMGGCGGGLSTSAFVLSRSMLRAEFTRGG